MPPLHLLPDGALRNALKSFGFLLPLCAGHFRQSVQALQVPVERKPPRIGKTALVQLQYLVEGIFYTLSLPRILCIRFKQEGFEVQPNYVGIGDMVSPK
jgi:hypothetical protein